MHSFHMADRIKRTVLAALAILALTTVPVQEVKALATPGNVHLRLDSQSFREETGELELGMTVVNGSSMTIPVCEVTADMTEIPGDNGLSYTAAAKENVIWNSAVPEELQESEKDSHVWISWNGMKPGETFSFSVVYQIERPETADEVMLQNSLLARIHIYDPNIPEFNSSTDLKASVSLKSALLKKEPETTAPERKEEPETKVQETEPARPTEPLKKAEPEKILLITDKTTAAGPDGGPELRTVYEPEAARSGTDRSAVFKNCEPDKTEENGFRKYLPAAVIAGCVLLFLLVLRRLQTFLEERRMKFDPEKTGNRGSQT